MVSGGITGTCSPNAADVLIKSSEMISFILMTASDIGRMMGYQQHRLNIQPLCPQHQPMKSNSSPESNTHSTIKSTTDKFINKKLSATYY